MLRRGYSFKANNLLPLLSKSASSSTSLSKPTSFFHSYLNASSFALLSLLFTMRKVVIRMLLTNWGLSTVFRLATSPFVSIELSEVEYVLVILLSTTWDIPWAALSSFKWSSAILNLAWRRKSYCSSFYALALDSSIFANYLSKNSLVSIFSSSSISSFSRGSRQFSLFRTKSLIFRRALFLSYTFCWMLKSLEVPRRILIWF